MAHKSSTGTVKNGRDSFSKRLGLKKFHNQSCKKGQILIRQRGLTFIPGNNVGRGKDFTLYALTDGKLIFKKIIKKNHFRTQINILLNSWDNLLKFLNYKNLTELKKDLYNI